MKYDLTMTNNSPTLKITNKIKSNRHYTRGIMLKSVTSDEPISAA